MKEKCERLRKFAARRAKAIEGRPAVGPEVAIDHLARMQFRPHPPRHAEGQPRWRVRPTLPPGQQAAERLLHAVQVRVAIRQPRDQGVRAIVGHAVPHVPRRLARLLGIEQELRRGRALGPAHHQVLAQHVHRAGLVQAEGRILGSNRSGSSCSATFDGGCISGGAGSAA
jgi:hypothetical protein